jgi:predicted ATPase
MYASDCIRIGRIENGWLIEINIPYKDEGPHDICCHEREKVFSVKTAEEAAAKIAELLPLLADKLTADEEFNTVFEEAAT